MNEAVIVGYARTAQSRSRPKDPGRDWFGQVRADTMAGEIANEVVKRVGIDPKEIDNCITGSAMGVNEQWTYGGRQPVFLANLQRRSPQQRNPRPLNPRQRNQRGANPPAGQRTKQGTR